MWPGRVRVRVRVGLGLGLGHLALQRGHRLQLHVAVRAALLAVVHVARPRPRG
jgi:hypothetical protein